MHLELLFRSQTRSFAAITLARSPLTVPKFRMDTDMEEHQQAGMQQPPPEAEAELTRLWRTWRTVHEMLVDRVRDGSLQRYSTRLTRHRAIKYQIES